MEDFSCFPPPDQSSTGNPIHPESKGAHPQVAVVNLAHCLDVKEGYHHVPLQLTVYSLFLPHESLNVLLGSTQLNIRLED